MKKPLLGKMVSVLLKEGTMAMIWRRDERWWEVGFEGVGERREERVPGVKDAIERERDGRDGREMSLTLWRERGFGEWCKYRCVESE